MTMDNSERIKAAAEKLALAWFTHPNYQQAAVAKALPILTEYFGESAPEQKYACNKCGYFGPNVNHPPCPYGAALLPVAPSVDTNAERCCLGSVATAQGVNGYGDDLHCVRHDERSRGADRDDEKIEGGDAAVFELQRKSRREMDDVQRGGTAHPADAPQEPTCAQCEMERKNGESIGLRHHECADIPLERRPQRPAPVVESSVLPSKSEPKEPR